MKLPLILSFAALFLVSCATPDPSKLENTIEVQDAKVYEKIEKARLRQENWDKRWDNYSGRQDAKYDAWIDGVFE